jgi:hydrogenase expression/formation protein
MDVEEFTRRRVSRGMSGGEIREQLVRHILSIKDVPQEYARAFSDAVIAEVNNTARAEGPVHEMVRSGVSMGEFGVGSRGTGDFYAHRQIARIIGKTGASVGVDEMDDAGAVRAGDQHIVCTVDGMHSRLSDFPFLAGFHVTRATLRDTYVMGARPILLFSDIHVADDGDVAKIFDYTAGICAVSEVMKVPLVTGSTLRIGGDMVLGSRMTGCVGAVGTTHHLTARRDLRPGDVLLMTEGAGGGTIATAALYSGFPDVVESTLNIQFLLACEALLANDVLAEVHVMTDVTNGGLRGDVYEMAETASCRIVVEEAAVRTLVDPRVLAMLDALEIDFLGVSLDALLIAVPPAQADAVAAVVSSAGVRIHPVGHVEAGRPEAVLVGTDGALRDFTPRFRESAYTPVKKVVDTTRRDFEEMKTGVDRAAAAAIRKKEAMISMLKTKKGD